MYTLRQPTRYWYSLYSAETLTVEIDTTEAACIALVAALKKRNGR